MEDNIEKSGSAVFVKKPRSLDLQSLYKSSLAEEVLCKGKNTIRDRDEAPKKKRKIRKALALSSFQQTGKVSKNTLDGDNVDGLSSSLASSPFESSSGQNLNGQSLLSDIFFNLDENGNAISIPKRRRGLIGRNKFARGHLTKPSRFGSSSDQITEIKEPVEIAPCEISRENEILVNRVNSFEQTAKLISGSNLGGKVTGLKVELTAGLGDAKGNTKRKSSVVAVPSSREGGHLFETNGDTSTSRKCGSKHRKHKPLVSGIASISGKVGPSVDSLKGPLDVYQDDDEENLEQNAARMLSSRFDPIFTGFSSKSRSSSSPYANEFNPNFDSQGLVVCSDSGSTDSASRSLRPRCNNKAKSLSRKRRHFYEIFTKDFDARWYLNRRIKVFWPLDESWYYGLVKSYDPETELHHIKYDDRDEEWINLQNERFKLLLFPSEVPTNAEKKRSTLDYNHLNTRTRSLHMNKEAFMESYMDSVPIISWLSSSRRLKSSHLGSVKKKKTSHMPSVLMSPLVSDKSVDACVDANANLMGKHASSPFSSSSPPMVTDASKCEKSVLESTTSAKDGHLPVVYVRRRSRRTGDELCIVPVKKEACRKPPRATTSFTPSASRYQSSAEYHASFGCSGCNELPWLDKDSILDLNTTFRVSKKNKFTVFVSVHPLLDFALGADMFWLMGNLLLQYGAIVTTWTSVYMELLFVDNFVGLRYFLYEGCLKRALAFIFLVLTMFHEPEKQRQCSDVRLPVTSVRVKLSCIQDFRKQLVFECYSFTKVKRSNWLYLDSELQSCCVLAKQLAVHECTNDDIKLLEGGSNYLQTFYARWNSSLEVILKKCLPDAPSMAEPACCLSVHLKHLMEHAVDSIPQHGHNSVCLAGDSCPQSEDHSVYSSSSIPGGNLKTSGPVVLTKAQVCTDAELVSFDGDLHNLPKRHDENVVDLCSAADLMVEHANEGGNGLQSEQLVQILQPLIHEDHTASACSGTGCFSQLNGMNIEIPSFDQVDRDVDRKAHRGEQLSDFGWNLSDGIICSPLPTPGNRSLWHRNRSGLCFLSFHEVSHTYHERSAGFVPNGFAIGPKKPRTQVQYTLPFGGLDSRSEHKIPNRGALPYKRIRRANEKRLLDSSRGSRKNLELLACDANLLITHGDRGWREYGARVFLEGTDQHEWMLSVKHGGMTKYARKVSHDMQPGSTNRYTHAMMWKGAVDWALEFPDRSQWMLFKEMYEECHNRNIRAASVRNIPIPGVRLLENFDDDDAAPEYPFVRSSKYFRQVETDVDVAMNPSQILYDMDSEDEAWIASSRKSLESVDGKCEMISDELFEKTMNMIEKVAYAQQHDHLTDDEIEEHIVGVGTMELVKAIYKHWQQKRQRKGMPLIRHLQPPLWENYQKQVKESEQLTSKPSAIPSAGLQDKAPLEKPPMFAFCLKPRGLEVVNKVSKHRPHRKYSISSNSHAFGDHDGPHPLGRRLHGFPFGDDRAVLPKNTNESSDASPLLYPSSRLYSPRGASGLGYFLFNGDSSNLNHLHRFQRNNSKKISTFPSVGRVSQTQRKVGKVNGLNRSNVAVAEWSTQPHREMALICRRHQMDGSDVDEFRLRDASGAAKHARNMARLKRERAQKLLYRADLAIHKAVSALMTAEAIEALQSAKRRRVESSEEAEGNRRMKLAS